MRVDSERLVFEAAVNSAPDFSSSPTPSMGHFEITPEEPLGDQNTRESRSYLGDVQLPQSVCIVCILIFWSIFKVLSNDVAEHLICDS